MPVTVDIPETLAKQLEAIWGRDLSRAAKEALAIESYRAQRISIGQLAHWLGLSIDEADGFLKSRGVLSTYSAEDLRSEVSALDQLLNK